MVQLRTYTVSDAPGCCAVIRACLPSLVGLDAAGLAHIAGTLTPDALHAELGPATALVVTDQTGMVLALGSLEIDQVRRLYVLPARHGQGIGTVLADALEARARSAGTRRLRVEASPGAVAFFRKRGYAGKTTIERRVGGSVARVVPMTKTLAG